MNLMFLLVSLFSQDSGSSREAEISSLIKQLSSDDIETRSRAEECLKKIGDPAVPFLEKAAEQGDPEGRSRCRNLVRLLTYETNARNEVDWTTVGKLVKDPEERNRYETLLEKGKADEILKEDYRWFLVVIDGLLSDRRLVAEESMRLLHRIIKRRRLDVAQYTELASKPAISDFRKAAARAEEYGYWFRVWYTKSTQDTVEAWKDTGTSESCRGLIETLKGVPQADLDKDETPAGKVLKTLRLSGPAIWPTLVAIIGQGDLETSRTTVDVLKRLTGRASELPTPQSKEFLHKEWENWLKDQR